MKNQQLSGYSMAGIGFAMLLINAFSYIFNWDVKSPAFSILGLIFVGIGLNVARKAPE